MERKPFMEIRATAILRVFVAVSLLTSVTVCGRSGPPLGQVQSFGPTSRIVDHENVRLAVDLMSAADHDRMAAMMGGPAMPGSKANYYVSLTILDQRTKKPLSTAEVNVTVTGPDSKKVSEPVHLMRGGGMAHYMAPFAATKNGAYTVGLEVTAGGTKHTHTVTFDIPPRS